MTDPQPAGRAVLVTKWAIALWMLAYTLAACGLLLDLWLVDAHVLCRGFGRADCASFPTAVVGAEHSVLGGVLGAGVLGMVSFHRYVSMEASFRPEHGWGYLFAPLLGGVLGLVTYALLQTGLLVFSGTPQTGDDAFVSNLGFLSVGFLAGFGWYAATRRIERLVTRFFGGDEGGGDAGATASEGGDASSHSPRIGAPGDGGTPPGGRADAAIPHDPRTSPDRLQP